MPPPAAASEGPAAPPPNQPLRESTGSMALGSNWAGGQRQCSGGTVPPRPRGWWLSGPQESSEPGRTVGRGRGTAEAPCPRPLLLLCHHRPGCLVAFVLKLSQCGHTRPRALLNNTPDDPRCAGRPAGRPSRVPLSDPVSTSHEALD